MISLTCLQLSVWFTYLGYTLIFASILTKSLRLYWIFSRKRLTISTVSMLTTYMQARFHSYEGDIFQKTKLSDFYLICGVAILSLATIVILALWSGKEKWRYQFFNDYFPLDGFASMVIYM